MKMRNEVFLAAWVSGLKVSVDLKGEIFHCTAARQTENGKGVHLPQETPTYDIINDPRGPENFPTSTPHQSLSALVITPCALDHEVSAMNPGPT